MWPWLLLSHQHHFISVLQRSVSSHVYPPPSFSKLQLYSLMKVTAEARTVLISQWKNLETFKNSKSVLDRLTKIPVPRSNFLFKVQHSSHFSDENRFPLPFSFSWSLCSQTLLSYYKTIMFPAQMKQ